MIGGITRHEFFPMPLEAVPAQFDFHQVEPGVDFVTSARSTSRRSRSTIRSARSATASTATARRGRTSPTPRRSTRCSTSSTSCPDPSRSPTTTRPRSARCATRCSRALHGVDTVVYDTHFLPEEYARFPHYGHSTPDQALEICAEAERAPPRALPPRAVAHRRPDGSDRGAATSRRARRSASRC